MAEELIDVRYFEPLDYHVISIRNPDALTNQQLEDIFDYLRQEHDDKRLAIKITDADNLTHIPNMDGLDIVSLAVVDSNVQDIDDSILGLQNLELLQLSNLPNLDSIPEEVKNLPRLVEVMVDETGVPQNIIDNILDVVEQRAEAPLDNDIIGGSKRRRRHATRRRSRKSRSGRTRHSRKSRTGRTRHSRKSRVGRRRSRKHRTTRRSL